VYPADLTLEVAGSLGEKAPPSLILLRRDYLEEAERRIGLNSYFWVRVDRPESIALVANALDEGFANSDNETETETEQGYYSTLIQTYRNLFKLMEVLGVIMLAAISFVAANTAAMSARERRREIAVLRAIGFTSRKVLLLLLAESTLVGLAGGLLGCAAAYAFVTFLPRLTAVSIAGMPTRLISVSLLLSTVLGFMSAIFSALPASRRNIVDALRLVA
jgi:putative ABC transport system permease protein